MHGAKCNLSALREYSLLRKDIIKLMGGILVTVLLLCIEAGQGKVPGLQSMYTKEFDDLMKYKQSTKARAKMYRRELLSMDYLFYGYDIDECPQRLHHIISDKKICKEVADKLEPELLSVHIYSSMLADEQLWDSIMRRRNCSKLNGDNLEICEKAFSGKIKAYRNFVMSNLNQEINNCYIEERVNLSHYLSKR